MARYTPRPADRAWVLLQVAQHVDDPLDRKIKAAAVAKRKSKRAFSAYVRGLRCGECGSRATKTEFYRMRGDARPTFGVRACDDCGAC